MKRTKTIDCLVPFTGEELRSMTKELTRLFWERANLEEEKKEKAKAFSDRIADLSLKISARMETLRLGGEFRPTACIEEFNTPEPGKKTVTRTDTGEVIAEKDMTEDEKNDIFIQNGDDELDPPENPEECPFDLEKDTIDILSIDREKDDPITGCMYRLQDKVYLCLTDHNACENCSIFGCINSPFCDFCSLDKIFKEVHPAAAPGGAEGDEPEAEDLPPPVKSAKEQDPEKHRMRSGIPAFTGKTLSDALGEDGDPRETCSVCGACHSVLHINNDKPICELCRSTRNEKNIALLDELEKYFQDRKIQPKFRAQFGYGCTPDHRDTTCFRLMLQSGSWGAPIYMAGDYAYTFSQAWSFYEELTRRKWEDA